MFLPRDKESHPARGAWIEMHIFRHRPARRKSHPARGAWIEMAEISVEVAEAIRRTPQGVRGLKSISPIASRAISMSHPARGAWIEIKYFYSIRHDVLVAPRKGCVD